MWDNLHITQIIDIINNHTDSNFIIQTDSISKALAEHARKFSRSKTFYTPFMQKAEESYVCLSGGKPDDITVIVTQIINK